MQQIITFFIRNKTFFLYLLLLSISLGFTFQSHSYHKSKFVNSANWFSGGIYESVNGIGDFFELRKYNQQLVEENQRLRALLINNGSVPSSIDSAYTDTSGHQQYKIISAEVIKNSFDLQKNYLTINKGEKEGIQQDMGVITSKGIVGIIENTSGGYATVQSVLNTISEINAQLKNSDHYGTLKWDGKNQKTVQLVDVSRVAPVKAGDTIITGGMSAIFPKGILIGTVSEVKPNISGNYFIIDIDLFNDMTSLGYVYVIENKDKKEIQTLENETINE
ncbi:rod shape-determining protein MreC [Zhouia spongiae]|uniref:Cell shape-determining protein MreC n=1 Tax=Zhouia spongiae TaxID=2202721 RepID=A0ABY3YQR7_9FLAO|nr:rod shape-determining protein MreC [Zhouia spongiae]UNZ00176.1 rod shape-determining protein MreC [Zhouia spongiae]